MAGKKPKTQLEKFKEAARQAEADESEEAFEERLKRIVPPKPKPKNEKAPDK